MFLIYYTDKPLLCIYYDYMNEYTNLLTESGRHIRSLQGCDITLILFPAIEPHTDYFI